MSFEPIIDGQSPLKKGEVMVKKVTKKAAATKRRKVVKSTKAKSATKRSTAKKSKKSIFSWF